MKLLGPIFRYDLIRIARRQRLALWRALYALAILLALYLLYAGAFPRAGLFGGQTVKGSELAAFATQFFGVFAALQFVAIILLTPALTANALSEERSHNTLLFLLTTHLTNREIVLGKLATRLLQVGFLVLTGLPVLGLMQMLGGVDQLLVVAAFAGAGLTALSLGSLGIACAVFAKKPQNAAWRAYQWVLLYAALSVVTVWMFDLPTAKAAVPGRLFLGGGMGFTPRTGLFANRAFGGPTTAAQDVMEAFNAGSPAFAYQKIYYGMMADEPLEDLVPAVLRDYAIVHGTVALLCLALAVGRLRAAAARQTGGLTVKRAVVLKPAPHPPVRDRPVLWKEVYCEAKPRQRWLALFFSRWFFAASFLPTWTLLVFGLESYERLTSWFHTALAFGGTLVAGLLILRVATHAARSVGSERDRQTLDSLLTTLLRPGEIVRDKWWGSVLAARWVFVWLAVHWGLGLVALAIHWAAVPLLALEVVVYSAAAASLGLYCATRATTTKQAVTSALLIGFFGTTLLPWALGQALMAALPAWTYQPPMPAQTNIWPGRYYRAEPVWPEKLALGLTPVRVLYESVVRNKDTWDWGYDWSGRNRDPLVEVLPPAALGLAVYAGLAALLAWRAAVRFRQSYGVVARPTRRSAATGGSAPRALPPVAAEPAASP